MKIEILQSEIQENDIDAYLIYNPINVQYFTGFITQSIARLIVQSQGTPLLFVPELEYEEAKLVAKNCLVKKIPAQELVIEAISRVLHKLKLKRIGIEEDYLTKKDYDDLTKYSHEIEYLNKESMIKKLRKTKTDDELEFLKEAAKIADIGMEKAIESIRDGISELEVAALAEYEMRKNGSEPIPFDTIVASGIRSAFPHATTTKHKIKKGDFVIIDLGAQFSGYVSDTSRTVIVGTPSEKQKEIYNLVLHAQEEAERRCKSGLKANELDNIARSIITSANYGKYFNHSLGHGVGLEVHEDPIISFRNNNKLEINNVITIEPGIYLPDFGGVRIEDTLIVKKDKCLLLNKSPKLKY
ncbi:MAG: M24 family metallopeptidase [Candidatus Helarchaeota archaeon]